MFIDKYFRRLYNVNKGNRIQFESICFNFDLKEGFIMAVTKKTTAAAKETAKEAAVKEVKTEAASVKTPAKKAPAKKAAPKKVAPKKPAAVKQAVAKAEEAKKAAAKEKNAEKAETKVNFFVEYAGKQVPIEEVIENVKLTYGKDAKEITVYLKPEESKAYFVADGEASDMDVFFC